MRELTHEQARAGLDALFVGDRCEEILAVREHLRGCLQCRGYFDALASMDDALLGGEERDDDAPPFARRYSDEVIAASVRAKAPGPWAAVLRWRPAPERHQVAALAAAAAVVVAGGWALWPLLRAPQGPVEPPGHEAFTPRLGTPGELAPGPRRRAGLHEIQIFCAARGPQGVEIVEPDAASGALRCGLDAELKFAFANQALGGEQALPWLTLVGVGPQGRLTWYHPVLPDEGVSARVGQSERLRLLGQTIRLSINHVAGPVRLYAVFSALPLTREAVSASLVGGALRLDGAASAGEGGAKLGTPGAGEYVVVERALEITDGGATPEAGARP